MDDTRKETIVKKTKLITLEFLVGIFFFAALGLLLYFTAVINGKSWFTDKGNFPLEIKFQSVDNLSVNDKVFLRGMEIGTVKGFALDEKHHDVLVTAILDHKINFYEDYLIEIRHTSLLGGKHIYLQPGTAGKGLTKDKPLQGSAPGDIFHEISFLLKSLRDDEAKLRKELLEGELIDNVKEAAKSIKETSAQFQKIVNSVEEGKGTLGKLVQDPSLYDDAQAMFTKIDEASKELTSLMREIKTGKGTLGKLVTDDTAYNNLDKAIRDLQEASQKIASGKGTLGKMISDDGQLYDNVMAVVDSTKKVTDRLAKGEGSLGKLMMDDDLYNDTRETVNQLRGAVEDYREQAPIATFGSMVLGAL